MANFWDTLVTSGQQLATKVVQPLGAGIGQSITNLVQQGQNKVSQFSSTIVKTTDPNKPAASQPAAPPTTSKIPPGTSALINANIGIIAVIALIVLFFYMRSKR